MARKRPPLDASLPFNPRPSRKGYIYKRGASRSLNFAESTALLAAALSGVSGPVLARVFGVSVTFVSDMKSNNFAKGYADVKYLRYSMGTPAFIEKYYTDSIKRRIDDAL